MLATSLLLTSTSAGQFRNMLMCQRRNLPADNQGIQILEWGNFCLWNPESSKFLLWNPESWALESGIQLKESGISLLIGIQNPSSSDKESEIHGVESTS